jgi:hypothetical protein
MASRDPSLSRVTEKAPVPTAHAGVVTRLLAAVVDTAVVIAVTVLVDLATAGILRAIACVLFPLGLLWSGISASRRSLQDLVLRTVVVYDVRTTVASLPVPHPRVPTGQTPASTRGSAPATRQPTETEPSQP